MAYYKQTRFGLERLESKPLHQPEKKRRKTRKRTPKQQADEEKRAEE